MQIILERLKNAPEGRAPGPQKETEELKEIAQNFRGGPYFALPCLGGA